MNRQIARLALVSLGLLASLVVATTYWQAWATGGLADRQDNAIQRVAQFAIERGEFLAGDGKTVLARSVPQEVGGRTLWFRRYPLGGLAAHTVGYSTQSRARARLERSPSSSLWPALPSADITAREISGLSVTTRIVAICDFSRPPASWKRSLLTAGLSGCLPVSLARAAAPRPRAGL